MTRDEALALKTFENRCTCGGYAYQMNGRERLQPHMPWCSQYREYAEWMAALALPERSNDR
jgi:hypothetical protein